MATKKEQEQVLTVDEVQNMVRKMLEEAKAEAAKIVEEAKAAAGTAKGWTAEEKAAHEAAMDELVEVKLFKDNGKYKDDQFVAVNGENIVIKRGERVKIKRRFAEVLDNSDRQDYETSKLIESKSEEFAKSGL